MQEMCGNLQAARGMQRLGRQGITVNDSPLFIRIVMMAAIVLGLVAVVAGFWFLAPFVIVLGLVIAIRQTRRTHMR